MNGAKNLNTKSAMESTERNVALCDVSKPKSAIINGVKIEKFNSANTAKDIPIIILTKIGSHSNFKSKKFTKPLKNFIKKFVFFSTQISFFTGGGSLVALLIRLPLSSKILMEEPKLTVFRLVFDHHLLTITSC